MWSRTAMNTAFVAAAGKLPERGTHSPACSTRGACRGLGKGGRRRRRAAWVRLSCGRAAIPPLARERGKRGEGGGRWWWKRCLRRLRKVPLIFKMGLAGSPPAHVAAGCQSAWEGSEITGSGPLTPAPDREEESKDQ